MAVDPRTPVLVGVGQFTERIDDPSYRGMSAVELAAAATTAALTDTGADVRTVARAIEVFVGLRQFEICTPFAKPPLGCSDNYLRSVAQRAGADPARAVLEPIGGNGPQKLVTEFAGAIAAGDPDGQPRSRASARLVHSRRGCAAAAALGFSPSPTPRPSVFQTHYYYR